MFGGEDEKVEEEEKEEHNSETDDNTPLTIIDADLDQITPNINQNGDKKPPDTKQIEQLMKNAEQVTEFCRTLDLRQSIRRNNGSRTTNGTRVDQVIPSPQIELLQSAQKLRKVITELLDTEKAYVRDLNCLVTRYLEPLQNEAFLSADEVR